MLSEEAGIIRFSSSVCGRKIFCTCNSGRLPPERMNEKKGSKNSWDLYIASAYRQSYLADKQRMLKQVFFQVVCITC